MSRTLCLINPWHRHRIDRVAAASPLDVMHVGSYDVCRCKAFRMTGDRRWRRKLPQGNPTVRTVN
jgi:hypothetical protein